MNQTAVCVSYKENSENIYSFYGIMTINLNPKHITETPSQTLIFVPQNITNEHGNRVNVQQLIILCFFGIFLQFSEMNCVHFMKYTKIVA